jgi:hypothetical protein
MYVIFYSIKKLNVMDKNCFMAAFFNLSNLAFFGKKSVATAPTVFFTTLIHSG